MESFVPYNQIDHPAMPKSRLNSLLIILMVTLLASGGALIVLKQIDTYHRQQLYIAQEAALPVHKTKLTKSDVEVKIFASPELGFIQDYAEFYEMSEISANETFPVLSYEKGPKGYQKGYRFASSLSSVFCPVLEVLVYSTEEKTATSWLNVNTDIKRAFAEQSSETINGVQFIRLVGPAGDIVPSQVYLALANKNLYQLNLNFGLKDDGVDPKCGNILSGFKLTNETSAEWKTYRNEEYGFEIQYPNNFELLVEGIQAGQLRFGIKITEPLTDIDYFNLSIYPENSKFNSKSKSFGFYLIPSEQPGCHLNLFRQDFAGMSVNAYDYLCFSDESVYEYKVYFERNKLMWVIDLNAVIELQIKASSYPNIPRLEEAIYKRILSSFKFTK